MSSLASLLSTLVAVALFVSCATASPLWVMTFPRYQTVNYNLSLLDPLTGTLSNTVPLNVDNPYAASYQTRTNAVFAATTSTLQLPVETWNSTLRSSQRQWVYFNTQTEKVDRVSVPVLEEYDICSVRDEAAGVTWHLSFNSSIEHDGSIRAFLWRYSDSPNSSSRAADMAPLFSVDLPFDAQRPSTYTYCAFNQAERLLYVAMNGAPSLLHTISVAKQALVQSTQYPGGSSGCSGLAYSNKQQQLYAYLTEGGGLVVKGVQAVDPVTGNNATIIGGEQLNVTRTRGTTRVAAGSSLTYRDTECTRCYR